ncbi:flagellar export protein FliJ [Desulfuribacillus stibiiarsenatis]|uniref:Flagellar FliJ protein n=1 Tax=Desulfuribacillus stibiiarsenatis TaxID=1390249 RepID=A0A1E5L6Q8_9FIRM|nr:flagellar export protein FliJ [Desulfuribacillus stibiiarsenatis]OEH85821.1 flagellar export protein FliJ [Desulfuribacillus stibiiarsenatis]
MKPFQYQYQKILDLKSKEVDYAKAEYAKSLKELENAELLLQKYKAEEETIQRELASNTSSSTHKICNYYQYFMKLKNMKENQTLQVQEKEKLMSTKQKELTLAFKEEKKWMKLKELQESEYNAEQTKNEQNTLDEISIQRFLMKKKL